MGFPEFYSLLYENRRGNGEAGGYRPYRETPIPGL
jgi:hypothetical protein